MTNLEHLLENAICACERGETLEDYRNAPANRMMLSDTGADAEMIWEMAQYVVYTYCVDKPMEYIDRAVTIEKIKAIYCADCNNYNEVRCRACLIDDALNCIDDAPAADVAPVVHGRWIDKYNDCSCAECSVCGEFYETADQDCVTADSFRLFKRFYKFCSNCGAMMDLLDIYAIDTADRCVCCGDVIPEGRMVCPGCEGSEPTSKSD